MYPCPNPSICGVQSHINLDNCRALLSESLRQDYTVSTSPPNPTADNAPKNAVYVGDLSPEVYGAIQDSWDEVMNRTSPYNENCGLVSRALRVQLERRGVFPAEVYGEFVGGLSDDDIQNDLIPSSREHVWLEIDGEIIDPTFRQFNGVYQGEMSPSYYLRSGAYDGEVPEILDEITNDFLSDPETLEVPNHNAEFDQNNDESDWITLRDAMEHPSYFQGNCMAFSSEIQRELEQGGTEVGLIEIRYRDDTHVANQWIDPHTGEDWVIDFTAKQFDSEYPIPLIARTRDWKQIMLNKIHDTHYSSTEFDAALSQISGDSAS